MSKTYKIYTAGKMSGLHYDQQMRWRKELEHAIRAVTDEDIVFVHPPQYYQYGQRFHKTEEEVRMWDLSQVKDSDIVVVDLSTIADSIGTHIELGVIEAMNEFGYKHIHVIGVGKPNTDHPWIKAGLLRQEDTISDAADYIVNYLLI